MTYRYFLTSLCGLLLLCFAFAPSVEASHFRYGEIRCEPTGNAGGLEYSCFVKESWRYGTAGLSTTVGGMSSNRTYNFSGPVSVNSPIVNLETIAALGPGSGNYTVAQATFIITFPQAGSYTINMLNSCCRIGGLGNPGISFRVTGLIEVGGNAMPRSSIPPIVGYAQSQTAGNPATQQLPVSDPDGDPVQCRLAPASAAGGGAQPAGFSVNSSCQMSWDNASLSGGLYWTQIYVDQLDGQGNIVQTTPYDFLLEIGGTSNTPPTCDIDGQMPFAFHGGHTIDVSVGDNLRFDLIAEDADGDDVEPAITTALGIGEVYNDSNGNVITQPFGVQPEPFAVTVLKEPLTAADVGTHQFTASVTDSRGATSQPCQLTVRVSEPSIAECPDELRIKTYHADQDGSGDGYVTFTNTGAEDVTLDACTFGVLHPIMETFTLVEPFAQNFTLPAGDDYTIGYAGAAVPLNQVLTSGQLAYDISAQTGGVYSWASYFGAFGKAYAVGDMVPDANDPDDEVIASVGVYQVTGGPLIEVVYPSAASKAGSADPFVALKQAIAEASAEVPTEFALEGAYPNPFNPATTIAYTLGEAADVRLTIYDALGRQVRTLVAHTQEAGTYEARWDGRDASGQAVASGVYLYKLEAGPHTAARTMLLAK